MRRKHSVPTQAKDSTRPFPHVNINLALTNRLEEILAGRYMTKQDPLLINPKHYPVAKFERRYHRKVGDLRNPIAHELFILNVELRDSLSDLCRPQSKKRSSTNESLKVTLMRQIHVVDVLLDQYLRAACARLTPRNTTVIPCEDWTIAALKSRRGQPVT